MIRGTAFIIDHSPEASQHIPDGLLSSYRPLSIEEIALTQEQIASLLTILADRKTYVPDMLKACSPNYELGVTLVSTHGYTEILFCLGCDMIFVATRDGEKCFGADIDRGHNVLLDFFRVLYPKNEALLRIRPNKPEEQFSAKIAIKHAEMFNPDDPLLKRVKAMKPEEQTDEILEQLAANATTAQRGHKKNSSKRKAK